MTDEDPTPTDLECRSCGERYAAGPDEPWRCTCGHALDFVENPVPNGSPPPFSRLDTRRGLWAFFEFLPVSQQVTLGEGFTPLVGSPDWDAQFKLEYVFPTGSFKDRGATTTLSRAIELGVDTVLEDSSGNAGASIATYAARAGLEAEIYVPDDLAQSKLIAIQRAGARPVRIEGDREAVSSACVSAVGVGEGWYASHAWNPAFLAGTMTFAFEVAAQRDWHVPDAVVIPTGHGTLLLGAYRGFQALVRAGIVDRVPRLLAGQARGYAPIAAAFGDDDAATPATETGGGAGRSGGPDGAGEYDSSASPAGSAGGDPASGPNESRGGGLRSTLGGSGPPAHNELADGIQIRKPARRRQIVDAIDDSGGAALAVGENEVELALDRLHRAGFYVEPTAAVGPAALRAFREAGVVDADDDVVVALTGSGLKTM